MQQRLLGVIDISSGLNFSAPGSCARARKGSYNVCVKIIRLRLLCNLHCGGDGVVVDGRGGLGSLDGGNVFVQAHSHAFPQKTLSCYQ